MYLETVIRSIEIYTIFTTYYLALYIYDESRIKRNGNKNKNLYLRTF